MVLLGAGNLHANAARVNALNVFPVPDGDTGTNMNMTMTSGVEELKKKTSSHLGRSAEALSKGLLMGARGNSGVILSQLFRGFAKSVQEAEKIGTDQFAAALQNGVDTSYKAILKPVEGTILTVAREAAKHATAYARRTDDVLELMTEVLNKAKEALAKTPEQLPVLKQVGVVDAGGQGLVCIYEGFVAALQGGGGAEIPDAEVLADHGAGGNGAQTDALEKLRQATHEAHVHSAQSLLSAEDIEFGYCTEFMVQLDPARMGNRTFDERGFRSDLEKHGDSILVVSDDDLVKVHIHAEYPGNVLTMAQAYGNLIKIKIDNMREQHAHILSHDFEGDMRGSGPAAISDGSEAGAEAREALKPFGFVAVSMGGGIATILESLGADVVLSGGQTMNPSTEDIVNAVMEVPASTVFVLPNNSNIIMAAQQAKELVDKELIVIPSKTIPQGMSALLAFQEKANAVQNTEAMNRAIAGVQSGQVTYAVRDTQIDGLDIKEGDYLGLHNNRIVASNPDLLQTCRSLLSSMAAEGGEIITILSGEDAPGATTAELVDWLGTEYPDVEVEVHQGGQPLYYYIFAVE
ncbi:DAK2 domain-containing protein [Paenibacillus sp. HJGM_3]|uniref:DAK2 domain-containing protein n=1 Tax=Paenibacillus sp. HJGM_3 TaxID=3379816 RepID=UPI0038599C85